MAFQDSGLVDRSVNLDRAAKPEGGTSEARRFELQEVRMAARNRGILSEALRYDITPTGLHYLLVHFDVPHVDAAKWRLLVSGSVKRELELDLSQLRALPAVSAPVTLECESACLGSKRHAALLCGPGPH
jgi:hypothetical protein